MSSFDDCVVCDELTMHCTHGKCTQCEGCSLCTDEAEVTLWDAIYAIEILAEERFTQRDYLINQLEWNSGGYGFGICSFVGMMIWDDDRPTDTKPDLKANVAVCGDPEKYEDEELEQLVTFAKRSTARYDQYFRWRRGCNLILFDKLDNMWMRKRLSWQSGPMYSPTLGQAIAVMDS